MKSEKSLGKMSERANAGNSHKVRWAATALAMIVGIVNFYYGNTYAGFYENLWYVMGGIYIFAAIILAADVMPDFVQPTLFAYSLFLLSLWAVAAVLTSAGTDATAYLDKALESVLTINLVILIRTSRAAPS